ncbi:MAG: shikimate kinase [Chitinivibrionales bacterium]
MGTGKGVPGSIPHIVLIGFASCGKSTIGRILARLLKLPFIDLDRRVEQLYESNRGVKKRCREIFIENGEKAFGELERNALSALESEGSAVLATGGGAPLREGNDVILNRMGAIIYLEAEPEVIFQRMEHKGLPAWLRDDPTVEGVRKVYRMRDKVYSRIADVKIETTSLTPEQAVQAIIDALERNNYFADKGM